MEKMPENEKKLVMGTSPHIASKSSTPQIMVEVCIALFPALVAGVLFFGFYSLLVVALSIATCVLFEFLFNLIRKRPQTINDFSAVVTGLILGLTLPPAVPVYVPIVGGIFAIVIVKMLFGGLGKNFANPAATARIFLVLAWTSIMSSYIPSVISSGNLFSFAVQSGATPSTGATPLASGEADLLKLFLGNTAGCIGETSALALIIGGAYLIVRKIIDWRIPLALILSFGLFTLIFKQDIFAVLPGILSGGVVFVSFFMATDYSTSPNTKIGRIIFAALIGFLNAFLRQFSAMTEGISFAIILANLVVPLIDKWIIPKPFGYVKLKKQKNVEEK